MSVTRVGDCVVVHAIAVHKSERRQGKATQALRDLVEKSRQVGRPSSAWKLYTTGD